MRTKIHSISTFTLVALLSFISVGQASEKPDPRVDNMLALDRNGDGALDEDEAPAGMFSLMDTNKDGLVERSELVSLLARSSRPFRWVNPPDHTQAHHRLTHATFLSPSMNLSVGYNIYLPPGYDQSSDRTSRYPVIYYLHGGRPGNESRSVGLVKYINNLVEAGTIRPVIFVWVNGGKVSHYDVGEAKGEHTFVNELIPHIDRTYRTIAHRGGRALQGFSQGGRGTTRIMFKYPELFSSAAPGGPGYATERQVFENGGIEKDTRVPNAPTLHFGKGNDAYSRAWDFTKKPPLEPPLKIAIWVGNKGFNYEATLEYLGFLFGLTIPVQRIVAAGIDHNPIAFYEAKGQDLLEFHNRHWFEVD